MRTIQVVNVRWYNATAWYGVELARCLNEAGHETIVAGLPGTPPLQKAQAMGMQTVALPFNTVSPVRLAQLWSGMERLLRNFRPDVVNCHRGEAFILWALMKKRHGFKLVRTRGDRRLPKWGMVNKWLHCSAADAIICTNSLMRRHFTEALHVSPAHVHAVLGGVDTQRFHDDQAARAEMRRRYGFAEGDIVAGLLGRMDVVKGIPETIRALARARELSGGNAPLKLLLIGFESQYTESDVRRFCAESGLGAPGEPGSIVTVTGKVDDPGQVINALDFGILSSLGSEAIARAALEIMACGVPLISSTVGVMPDLIPQPWLFAPGDIEAMSRLMLDMADAEKRGELRAWCAGAIAQKKLRLQDFLEQTLAIYEGIAK